MTAPESPSPSQPRRPSFGACGWSEDCHNPAEFTMREGRAPRCRYHREVEDRSIEPYFIRWFHARLVCGECGAPATKRQRRAGHLSFRCETHRLAPTAEGVS